MRPRPQTKLLIVLMVALCANAELWPNPSQPQNTSTDNLRSNNQELTFQAFKHKYRKKYETKAQDNYRKLIFMQNVAICNQHNSHPSRKYDMEANFFSDMTDDQFQHIYTTTYPSNQQSKAISREITGDDRCWKKDCGNQNPQSGRPVGSSPHNTHHQNGNTEPSSGSHDKNRIENGGTARRLQSITNNASLLGILAHQHNLTTQSQKTKRQQKQVNSDIEGIYIDWSAYAGPVRFQGFCGACYAFATVDTVSSHLAIYKYGFFHQLSVQQIVECADNGLTFGCFGGYLEGALTHIITNGIVSQTSYPFTSGDDIFGSQCKQANGGFKIQSFLPLEQGSCSSVIKELYQGPISAGISGRNLRQYKNGVFDNCTQSDNIDHAVVIVGYRSGYGWRIKNSWGDWWGEKGMAWIAEGNTCWICNMTVSITI